MSSDGMFRSILAPTRVSVPSSVYNKEDALVLVVLVELEQRTGDAGPAVWGDYLVLFAGLVVVEMNQLRLPLLDTDFLNRNIGSGVPQAHTWCNVDIDLVAVGIVAVVFPVKHPADGGADVDQGRDHGVALLYQVNDTLGYLFEAGQGLGPGNRGALTGHMLEDVIQRVAGRALAYRPVVVGVRSHVVGIR